MWSAKQTAFALFSSSSARGYFAGLAAHSILPLEWAPSGAFGWIFALAALATGWPLPRGGAQSITNALASYFDSLGGEIETNHEVKSLSEFPSGALVLCDVTPRQLLRIAGQRLPDFYCRRLERYRYGPGVFKVDWALNAPIPWRNSQCRRAGTVHVGGTFEEMARSERAPWHGEICRKPFVLVTQPSLFDASRAPEGFHTAWAYCHVPNGSTEDMTEAIELQMERFAPGFRDTIVGRHTMPPAALQAHNPNLIGGDIIGGAADASAAISTPDAQYVSHSGAGSLPVLSLHAAGRRCSRNVRLPRRESGIARSRTSTVVIHVAYYRCNFSLEDSSLRVDTHMWQRYLPWRKFSALRLQNGDACSRSCPQCRVGIRRHD